MIAASWLGTGIVIMLLSAGVLMLSAACWVVMRTLRDGVDLYHSRRPIPDWIRRIKRPYDR